MEIFQYVAIAKDGKEKKGNIESASVEAATASLKAEGLIPISVSEQSFLSKDINITIGKLVKPRDLSLFCRQFVGIISAGVSIVDALDMIGDQTANKHLQKALKETLTAVQKGETLAHAMRMQGDKIFPPILINMVEAGEASGNLEIAFERMATQFEKDAKMRAMIKKAMVYPCVVGVVAIGVIIVMMTVVIPNFEGLFNQIGGEMPAITKVVQSASKFFIAYWYMIVAVIFGIIMALKFYSSTASGEELFAKIALAMPLFGDLKIKGYSSRYARTISTLLAAGIPLIDAIDITAKTIENKIIRQSLISAKEEVARGVPLSVPMKACGHFPPMVCHMTKIGEETGNMEAMLERLADYYDEEVEVATQSLTAAMEPMIILVLAAVVGVLIAAIMSPMMTMYDSLGNL